VKSVDRRSDYRPSASLQQSSELVAKARLSGAIDTVDRDTMDDICRRTGQASDQTVEHISSAGQGIFFFRPPNGSRLSCSRA
jgi:hypothetical protein